MGLLTVACGQTLDHIPLLFDTYEAQKHAASALVENFGYITFAATTYATAEYAKAYFSHPGWKDRKQLRDERREERRERIRRTRYSKLRQDEVRVVETNEQGENGGTSRRDETHENGGGGDDDDDDSSKSTTEGVANRDEYD